MNRINLKKYLFRPYHPGGILQKILLWLFRAIIVILFLNFLLFLVLQIPAVQNRATNYIKDYLQGKSGTKVELKGLQFNFFNNIELQDFSINDLHGNPLIFTKILQVDFSLNPYNLYRSKIIIDQVVLKNAGINLRKYTGETEQNIDMLLAKMFPRTNDKPKKESKIILRIKSIELANVEFTDFNENNGSYLSISTQSGEASVKNIDFGKKEYIFSKAFFESPVVKVQHRKPAVSASINSKPGKAHNNSPSKPLKLVFQEFEISKGTLMVDNFQKPLDINIDIEDIDWAHFKISEVDATGKNLTIHNNTYSASPIKLSLKESKGFEIKEMKASFAGISNEQIRISDLLLKTQGSILKDSIILNYESLDALSSDFNNNVALNIGLNKSLVAVKDIAHFAPQLKKDAFFKNNFDEILTVSGQIKGRINSLKAKKLEVEIPGKLYLDTEFKSNDISDSDNAIINLAIHELKTNVKFLEKAIPGLVLPPNFSKLGDLSFKGKFDGFFTDFVTYGTVNTNLGDLDLDVRMNLQNGKEKASYSGGIKMFGFDLGAWTDNKKFGKLSSNFQVRNGIGFTAEKAEADLGGEVLSINYNGYTYKNIILNGVFKKNIIDGTVSGSDPNADFYFKGRVDFANETPTYNFLSDIKNIDLFKLNLTSKPLNVSGNLDINLQTKNFKTLIGTSQIRKLKFSNNEKVLFFIDSISLRAQQNGNNKIIKLRSDIADIDLVGDFEIDNLHKVFLSNLENLFPRYYSDLKLPAVELNFTKTQCNYSVDIKTPAPLLSLMNNPFQTEGSITLKGNFDNKSNEWRFELGSSLLKLKEYSFKDIAIKYDQFDEDAILSGVIGNSKVFEKNLPPVRFSFLVNTDSIRFDIKGLELYNSDLSMNGILSPSPVGYKVHFKNDVFKILGEEWEMNPDNLLYFEKDRVSAAFFSLTHETRKILLNNTENNGLEFAILGYDLSNLNELIKYDKIKLSGNLQIYARILDVYKMKNFGLIVYSDSLNLNNDHWGKFKMNTSAENFKDFVFIDYELEHDTISMYGKGFLELADKENLKLKLSNKFNYLPLKALEYFIGTGIKNTSGSLKGNFNIEGPLSYLDLTGKASINKAGFHLNYTNVDYTIKGANLSFTNKMIDATGSALIDPAGNLAKITGGLVHDHFKHWGYDVKIQSPEFIGLNTTRQDNPIYFGKGIGAMTLTIGGSFEQTNMYINATTAKGSSLTIPFGNTEQAKASSFIKFANKFIDTTQTSVTKLKKKDLSGLNVDMDLTVTEDALMQIILDPQAGDYIKGFGKGNIQLAFTRTGEFTMFGDYEIQSGEYLFTLLNLVNKPFSISQGSIVRWAGDPYEGEINLTASYRDLYTSPYNFIIEYLGADNNAITEARNTTKVDLDLSLSGRLLSPNIKLDLNFPNISPILRNYIDSKLRIVRQDQNEMNRQAMALIVTKTFIPPNNGFQGTQYLTSINTLSELMSNQLSGYLTELFSDFIKENGVISGIDLVVGYNVYDASTVNPFSTSEFQLRMKNNLFADRLSINIGGNVGTNASSTVNNQTYFAGDLEVTYALTPDNRLKVRVYQRTEPSLEGGRKNRSGIGISYRREFNNFSEVISELKNGMKKNTKSKVGKQ